MQTENRAKEKGGASRTATGASPFAGKKESQPRAHGGCLWLSEAKKDVTSCEKRRRAANALRPGGVRMGKPVGGDPHTAPDAGRTRGTETSKYPQEKKTTVIAQVAASERARAQTGRVKARPGL